MQTAFARVSHAVLVGLAVSGCGVRLAAPIRPATVSMGGGTTVGGPPSTVASLLSAGPEYTCAIHAAQVFCWGRNSDGQLGDGTTVNRSKPTAVVGVRDAIAVRSSEHLACAVLRDGEVTCWGDGLGTRLIAGMADAIDVAPSFRLVCAVRRSGKVSCVGLPWRYEDKAKRTTPVLTELAGIDDAIGIASSRRETCVVRRAGALACFASDSIPGRSNKAGAELPVLGAPFTALPAVSQLTGNYDEFCAALRDGRVTCWKDRTAPANVRSIEMISGLADVAAVSFGQNHRCARQRSGSVACWGLDLYGMLGATPPSPNEKMPVTVPDLPDAVDLSVGTSFACARRKSGTVVCWGSASHGALGDGSAAEANEPSSVEGIGDAVSVAAGQGFSCAADRQGAVWCWGHGDWSQSPDVVPPRRIQALQGSTSLQAHGDKLWAIRDGHLLGILGIADLVRSQSDPVPTAWLPPALSGATALVEIGERMGAALLSGGQMVLWTESIDPRIGFETVPVRGLTDAVALAAGSGSTCAVRRNGHVTCVQMEESPFGASPDPTTATTVEVPGISAAVGISGAESLPGTVEDYAAVLRSGRIVRWSVQRGLAEVHEDPFARDVTGVSLARNFACALLSGGRVVCGGSNEDGELGTGDQAPGPMYIQEGGGPFFGHAQHGWVAVKDLDDATAITTGEEHACAIRRNGRVVCWGSNAHLEVGLPFPPFRARPMRVSGLDDH